MSKKRLEAVPEALFDKVSASLIFYKDSFLHEVRMQ